MECLLGLVDQLVSLGDQVMGAVEDTTEAGVTTEELVMAMEDRVLTGQALEDMVRVIQEA